MLEITFKDGASRQYTEQAYTDYEYLKDIFVVLDGSQWIGIYSMSEVKSIECYKDPVVYRTEDIDVERLNRELEQALRETEDNKSRNLAANYGGV